MPEPSLRDIQAAYFDGLEQIFKGPFSQMKKFDANCVDITADLASSAGLVAAFEHDCESFFGELVGFWDRNQVAGVPQVVRTDLSEGGIWGRSVSFLHAE
jgi:hypothetical protein